MNRATIFSVIAALVLFPVGWLGGRLVMSALTSHHAQNAATTGGGGTTGGTSGGTTSKADSAVAGVAQQAIEAYKAGKYPEAMGLFKQYMSTLNPQNDKDAPKMKIALAYVEDIQRNLDLINSGLQPNPPQEQARLVQQATAAAQASAGSATDPTLGEARVPHKAIPAGTVAAMTIKEMANFEFDPTTQKAEDVPADIKAMEGSHLKLSGYMIPLNQANEITSFALVPSLVSCCYGAPPGVQHVITVEMETGKTVDYSMDELEVEGTLHIDVKRQDGYTYQLFSFTGKNVKLKE